MAARKTFDVVALGYSAVDYLGIVPHLPELDSKLPMDDFTKQGGGPAGTAAAAAARLGARTAFVGQIGDDEFGDFMLREFERDGVDTSHVIRCKGRASQFSFIMVDRQTGKRTIIWTRSDIPPLDPARLDRQLFTSCRVLHMDRHELAAGMQAAKWVRDSGGLVTMDAGTYKPEIAEVLPYVDVLITSHAYAQNATGETDPLKAAKLLLDHRLAAGVTCGEHGACFATADDCFHIPAFDVDVVDTTGAGDVFHGAFAYGLAQEWDVRRCAVFSSAAAAIKCTRLGGRAGIPTRAEAEEFIARSGR